MRSFDLTRTPDNQPKSQYEGLAGADGIPKALKRTTALSDEIKAKDAFVYLRLVHSGDKTYLKADWNVTTSTGKHVTTEGREYATIKSFVEALKYRLEV
jgi:hypothetical protein